MRLASRARTISSASGRSGARTAATWASGASVIRHTLSDMTPHPKGGPRHRVAIEVAAIAGGALVLVLLLVDVLAGASAALIPLLLVGPALAAITSAPRPTAWVAALAVSCGIVLAVTDGV